MSPTSGSHDLGHPDVGMAWPLTASSGCVECGGGLLRARALGSGGLVTEAVETWALLRERLYCSLLNLAWLSLSLSTDSHQGSLWPAQGVFNTPPQLA